MLSCFFGASVQYRFVRIYIMARKVGDINSKIAYITHRKSGPILKVKRPLFLRELPSVQSNRRANGTIYNNLFAYT